jgi:hypothetical protein
MTPCSQLKVSRHFGGTCGLHLRSRRLRQARNQHEADSKTALLWFLAVLILPWRGRRHVPPKRRLTFNGLYGVISQMLELFITTAVRTSNRTYFIHALQYQISWKTIQRFSSLMRTDRPTDGRCWFIRRSVGLKNACINDLWEIKALNLSYRIKV